MIINYLNKEMKIIEPFSKFLDLIIIIKNCYNVLKQYKNKKRIFTESQNKHKIKFKIYQMIANDKNNFL